MTSLNPTKWRGSIRLDFGLTLPTYQSGISQIYTDNVRTDSSFALTLLTFKNITCHLTGGPQRSLIDLSLYRLSGLPL